MYYFVGINYLAKIFSIIAASYRYYKIINMQINCTSWELFPSFCSYHQNYQHYACILTDIALHLEWLFVQKLISKLLANLANFYFSICSFSVEFVHLYLVILMILMRLELHYTLIEIFFLVSLLLSPWLFCVSGDISGIMTFWTACWIAIKSLLSGI